MKIRDYTWMLYSKFPKDIPDGATSCLALKKSIELWLSKGNSLDFGYRSQVPNWPFQWHVVACKGSDMPRLDIPFRVNGESVELSRQWFLRWPDEYQHTMLTISKQFNVTIRPENTK